jgi:hypothetical protein
MRKLIIEGGVIVASILIAFGLDAWWDRFQMAGDLRDELANVAEEMSSNLAMLRLEIRFTRTAISSTDQLVIAIDANEGAETVTVPDTLVLSAIVFNPSYDPSTGALDALISSGMLARLDEPALKKTLSEFRTLVEDIREDELYARRISNEVIMPNLWQDPVLRGVMPRINEFYSRGLDSVPLPTRPAEMTVPPGLVNQLLARQSWLLSAIREMELLEAGLEDVERRLMARLGS